MSEIPLILDATAPLSAPATPSQMIPESIYGRIRLVSMPANATPKQIAEAAEEQARLIEVAKRRMYYAGDQYFAENAAAALLMNLNPITQRLPEKNRKHAYSTQIQESIDFLADRIGEGFAIEAEDSSVQDVLDAMIAATDVISAETDTGDQVIVTDEILRDALITGDVAVYIGWDAIEERPYLEFWDSESVEFVFATSRKVIKVIKTLVVWKDFGDRDVRQVIQRAETDMGMNDVGVMEARTLVYTNNGEEPDGPPEWHGVGRIPWVLMRADARTLRAGRGESPMTDQAMHTADRYNAVEQVAWLIARYNSHANVAVIGDGASLKLEADGRISKDVADVLTFPGGTALETITLPTDPQMIEHQRAVLADSLYSIFGLVRVEPDTLQGMSQVSGYALEIMNQKTDGTFKRVRRHWRKDWISLVNCVLDVTAWRENAQTMIMDPATGDLIPLPSEIPMSGGPTGSSETTVPPDATIVDGWWLVDPNVVYPNRTLTVRMGTGYIVDDVRILNDFVAKLISIEEALRQRGMTDTDIKRVVAELKAAQPAPPPAETGLFGKTPVVLPGVSAPVTTLTPPPVKQPMTAPGSTVASGSKRG